MPPARRSYSTLPADKALRMRVIATGLLLLMAVAFLLLRRRFGAKADEGGEA